MALIAGSPAVIFFQENNFEAGMPLRFIVPFTVIFTAFLGYNYAFGLYLFPMLLPDMREDLGLSYAAVGSMTAAAQVAYVVGSLGASAIAAKIGSATTVVASTTLCGLALLLIGISPSVPILAAVIVAMGAAAASVWIPMVAVVSRHVTVQHRGTVLGVFSSAGAFGAVLSGATVPLVLNYAGWRGVWGAAGAITLFTVVLGSVVLAHMKVLANDTGSALKPQTLTPSVLRKVAQRHVILVWLTIFIGSAVCIPFQTYLSAFLRENAGRDPAIAASTWMTIGLVGSVGGGLMGLLADRVGVTRALTVASIFVLAACAILWLDQGPPFAFVSGVFYGLSYYAIFGLVPAYISKTIPSHETVVVFSVANVMVGLGGAAGNFLGGFSQELTGSLGAVYAGCAVGAAVLLLVVSILPSEQRLPLEASRRPPRPVS